MNLLRSVKVNKKLSAHTFLHGKFNFRITPLAPPGTRVVAHTKPGIRNLWALNGEDGWYVGPAPYHYRNINIFFPKTGTVRPVDIV